MRILYFRLKGYAGIYHGMGLNEIVIPFSQFPHKIILIQGTNGCGKSTILNALSLDIDGSDAYRADATYDPSTGIPSIIEYPAEKEIHLQEGQDIYRILIQSNVKNGKRVTTKAYISRNGIELNENGNVSSYKDIRNNVLDMDPNYISLSMISSENRGLVDKNPSDRKRFMSNIVDSLEFFNEAFKTLSKKAYAYKTSINSIKNKILNIGDPDILVNSYNAGRKRLKELDTNRQELNKSLAECKATIKLLDPDGKIQDLYQSILGELETINTEIASLERKLGSLYSSIPDLSQKHIFEIQSEINNRLSELDKSISSNSTEVRVLLEKRDDISNRASNATIKLNNLESVTIRADIKQLMSDLSDKSTTIETILKSKDINMDEFPSKDMISAVRRVVMEISRRIILIREYQESDIISAFDMVVSSKDPVTSEEWLTESINKTTLLIADVKNKIYEYESVLSKISILDNRPKGCKIDSCYFIKEALSYDKNETERLLEEQRELLDLYERQINGWKQNLLDLGPIKEVYGLVDSLLYYMQSNKDFIDLFREIKFNPFDVEEVKSIVVNRIDINIGFVDDMLAIADMIKEHGDIQLSLLRYDSELSKFNNNNLLRNELSETIEGCNKELSELDTKVKELNQKIVFDNGVKASLSNNLLVVEEIIATEDRLSSVRQAKKELSDRFQKVKDSIKEVQSKVDQGNKIDQQLILLEQEYEPLKNSVDTNKYYLSKLESYREDLLKYGDLYDKTEFIKKACSPTSGIQSIYISIYMSKTIQSANALLRYLFNGTISLLQPEINQDEFRIPFTNEYGSEIPDVSLGSTSQKCMIALCLGISLLSQGSEKFNIIRLDEIDGGLDTNNRMQFIQVLMSVIDLIHAEQCIMISHNIESETYGADIIHVSNTGLSFGTV